MARRDPGRSRRGPSVGVLAFIGLAAASVGCDEITYYTGEPCIARVALRTEDGRGDAPCRIDLVPVGRPRPFSPQPARLNRVDEYRVTVSRSFGHPRENWPRSRAVATCEGYQDAESAPFSFDPGLVSCPAVDLGQVVLAPKGSEDAR